MKELLSLVRRALLATALLMWIAGMFALLAISFEQLNTRGAQAAICPVMVLCVTAGTGVVVIARIINYLSDRG